MSIDHETNVFNSRVMSIHRARVNRASLQAESRIIRREERRAGVQYRSGLHLHRIGRLREESRIANLAFAYLRGREYRAVEAKCHVFPESERIVDKLARWGFCASPTQIFKWLTK